MIETFVRSSNFISQRLICWSLASLIIAILHAGQAQSGSVATKQRLWLNPKPNSVLHFNVLFQRMTCISVRPPSLYPRWQYVSVVRVHGRARQKANLYYDSFMTMDLRDILVCP